MDARGLAAAESAGDEWRGPFRLAAELPPADVGDVQAAAAEDWQVDTPAASTDLNARGADTGLGGEARLVPGGG